VTLRDTVENPYIPEKYILIIDKKLSVIKVWFVVLVLASLAACQTTPVERPSQPPPGNLSTKPVRVGLALGGGAARGFAHIGVIQVLQENGIQPDLVVGTSAGSLVATLYASGQTGAQMTKLAATMDESALTDWSFPGRGLIRGDALAKYVREQTGGRRIEQMKLPLGIVATDLSSGNPVLFLRGDAGTAVRASSAVPAVFFPVKIGEREYVDGGLVSPVPVRFARQMGADFVIAVDISAPPNPENLQDPFHLLLQTYAIMGQSINRWELNDAQVVVRPRMSEISSADFTARLKSIEAGRAAAVAILPTLKAALAKVRQASVQTAARAD